MTHEPETSVAAPRRSFRFHFAAAVLSALVFLVVVEVIVRLVGLDPYFQDRFFVLNRSLDYPEIFDKDHDLFWRFRPDRTVTSRFFDNRTYHINSHGVRGSGFSELKTSPRIVALGNSCTFGWGVTDDQTFTASLQQLAGSRIEVINAGIPGYSSLQGKRYFEKEVIQWQPDIVLILFAWNDHWAAANKIADKDQRFPPQAIIEIQNRLSRLHSYRLLKKLLLGSIEPSTDSLFDRQAPDYRVSPEEFAANLRELCSFARSRNVRPILLTSPIPSLSLYYPAGARSPMHDFHQRYNNVIRALARTDSPEVVDLDSAFATVSGLWDNAPKDPIHFNARGHALAAQLIYEKLEDGAIYESLK